MQNFTKINFFMAKLKQHWSSYLPPFGIIKKEGQTVKQRVFAITTTWVMEESNMRYTQVFWYDNEIGHPSHT